MVVFSDTVFFVLEEDSFLDDNKFEGGFDSPSTLSVRGLWLDPTGLLEGDPGNHFLWHECTASALARIAQSRII